MSFLIPSPVSGTYLTFISVSKKEKNKGRSESWEGGRRRKGEGETVFITLNYSQYSESKDSVLFTNPST